MSRIIFYQKVHPKAKTPTKAYDTDACWDLYAAEEVTVLPFSTKAVDTGLAFEILPGEKLHIYSRSGLALKEMVCVFNAPGVIDANYVNSLKVILYNGSAATFKVKEGMRIAQFSREIVLDDRLEEGIVNTDTNRGLNGLGSTGV